MNKQFANLDLCSINIQTHEVITNSFMTKMLRWLQRSVLLIKLLLDLAEIF